MKIRKLRWRFYRKTGGPRLWGKRCKAYARGCLSCDAYLIFHSTGRFPTTMDEVEAILPPPQDYLFEIDIPWDKAIKEYCGMEKVVSR